MHHTIAWLALSAAAATAASCKPEPRAPAGPARSSDAPRDGASPAERLAAAAGGKDRIAALERLEVEASGGRWILDEGARPEAPADQSSTFDARVRWDLATDHLRIDVRRRVVVFGLDARTEFSLITSPAGGAVTGNETIIGLPPGPLPPDRWAAIRRQQRLLHPAVLARRALRGELAVTAAAGGQLEIADPVAPLRAHLDPATGRLQRITTREHHHSRGDVEIAIAYDDWQPVAGGPDVPRRVTITVDGARIHEERRSQVAVPAAAFPAEELAPPATAPPDAELAALGEAASQYYEMFASTGIPVGGRDERIAATAIAPGVFHLEGGGYHSLVVAQERGTVVIEAPLHELRARAMLAWIDANLPGKPITHVVASHHHADHVGGLRAFVARGAAVVAGAAAVPFYERVLSAPRTVRPDEQSRARRDPVVIAVPEGGSHVIPDPRRPVGAYAIASTHAADLVLAHVGGANLVFVADIYSPGNPPWGAAGLEEVRAGIARHRLEVARIAGGHGRGTTTPRELEAQLAKLKQKQKP